MINLVMRPTNSPVKNYEKVYEVEINGEKIGFTVRGKNARHAEEKIVEVFRNNLSGKSVDFDLEAWLKHKTENAILSSSSGQGDADSDPAPDS